MKLLQKTNRYYLIFSVIIFSFAGIALYVILTVINKNEINEKLHETKVQVIEHIKNREVLPNLYPLVDVHPVSVTGIPYVKDTLIYDPVDKEYEKYRVEVLYGKIGNFTYRITLRRSYKENKDYMLAITISLMAVFIILFVSLFFMNRSIAKKIWSSFFKNLDTLKHFSLPQNEYPLTLQKSEIDEFQELNHVMEKLTERVISDYQSLKAFTVNASHEIQTPLAVMITKLEMLLQSPALTEQQVRDLHFVYSAAQRLSKLNHNLLLLAKIENNRFEDTEDIVLQNVINTQLELLYDFIHLKELDLQVNMPSQSVVVKANRYLVGILVANLLNNAVLHNIQRGNLFLSLTKKDLRIENTGHLLQVDPDKLFDRFYKADTSSDSPGLGLAIVKQICNSYQWRITYIYSNRQHTVTVLFG